MHPKVEQLAEQGQSLWCDTFSRQLLRNGEIKRLIGLGVSGITSNPSMFRDSILGGSLYDRQIARLTADGCPPDAVYERLAVKDIQTAADMFRPVFDRTGGLDGYVSLEVSPLLAHDWQATLEQVRHLWQVVNRPNLMIKIPATPAGLLAIEESLADGININITLIFGLEMYEAVMDAYLRALERRVRLGKSVERVRSVASLFVSRVDGLVDRLLDEQIQAADGERAASLAALKGRAGLANAKLAYQSFRRTFASPRFRVLAARGAHIQRLLWASTSTKNPDYRDVMYLEALIGPGTINTAPLATIDAFLDHGVVSPTVEQDVEDARQTLAALKQHGIDIVDVTNQLLAEGLDKFAEAHRALIEAIGGKVALRAA